ncbi:DUF1272 domain-containing protein [Algibacter luteus]|jgi:hypothetical protein|uniref:DUF1272 domain-containing protein n=1 Tax=Algibacter luteus TaxID=1178825 RepID=UPI0025914951|nr:DUF1272 domain-containing protein [Algibacter luteus]WJJ97435.1 DUF1272 domain-containing protein [Algibacter luteus]
MKKKISLQLLTQIGMLEIRPTCEHCNKALPYNSKEAMICTFECTFCKDCVDHVLQLVCPNCGGDFQPRPIRPSHLLSKYPVSAKTVYKPVNVEAHLKSINKT